MTHHRRLALAKSMLKRNQFRGDTASADTIWRQMKPETREDWLSRADLVLEDMERDGYTFGVEGGRGS